MHIHIHIKSEYIYIYTHTHRASIIYHICILYTYYIHMPYSGSGSRRIVLSETFVHVF